MSAEQKDNRTATQRLDDVERVVASLYNGLQQIANGLDSLAKSTEDFSIVKQAVRLMSKRLECAISVAKPESGITLESVDNAMIAANVLELKEQVATWVSNGALTATDTVAERTFVVASERSADGAVVNPRTQFTLETQGENVKTALAGKKVGDLVDFGKDKLSLEILELYAIAEPKPAVAAVPAPAEDDTKGTEAAAPAAEAAPAEGPTTDAPAAAEAPTTDAPAAAEAPAQTA